MFVFVAEEKERAAVAKYAKNFLPRLFNLIAPVDEEDNIACRLAALETLKCYLKICDRQVRYIAVLIDYFLHILEKDKTSNIL